MIVKSCFMKVYGMNFQKIRQWDRWVMKQKRERREKRKRYLLKWWTVWTGGNEYPFGVIAKPVKPCKPLYVA